MRIVDGWLPGMKVIVTDPPPVRPGVLKVNFVFVFEPKPDITVYEIALAMAMPRATYWPAVLIHEDHVVEFEGGPLGRHFRFTEKAHPAW